MMQAEKYLNSRTRDAIALSHEIQESKGDLGYVTVISTMLMIVNGKPMEFHSPAAMRAYILQTFW